MVLYLAGLKAVDTSLREAAPIDGCNEWQSFRRVIFPSLKPINVVVAVITVIEALRAYDIIAALNTPRGTEVMGTLVTTSLVGEGGGRVGIGSAYGMVLFVLCIGFVVWYVTNAFREELQLDGASSPLPVDASASTSPPSASTRRGGVKPMRVLLYVVLTVLALGVAGADRHGGVLVVPLLRGRHPGQRRVLVRPRR